jgi:hypothetical protein
MKVRAKRAGTFKGLRNAGEVFEYDGITSKTVNGKKVDYFPSWMEPLEKPAAKPGRKPAASKQDDGEGSGSQAE